jgi:2',3'-cyclic-nucleotide 2'-phosphodiesterase (5'-nucleotidase family)
MKKCGMFSAVLSALALTIMAGHASAQPILSKSNISSVGSGLRETGFGDLAADTLRSATNADIAFVPAAAFRSVDLPATGLDTSQLSSAIVVTDSPSDGYVLTKLTGAEVFAALERSVSRLPESFGGFLQVSGIKIVYDLSKSEGSRVTSIEMSDGVPVSVTATYLVAMTRPLANGDMGYFQIWDSSVIVKEEETSFSSALEIYAAAHQPLTGHPDGRLASL